MQHKALKSARWQEAIRQTLIALDKNSAWRLAS